MKSWFITVEAGLSAQRYLDPKQPGIVPRIYMGFDEEVPVEQDEVCERWSGPAGEHIYHVHGRDDPRWETFVGGDFLRRKSGDHGRVYMFLTSPSWYWSLTAIQSLAAHFPNARRRCLTKLEGDIESLPILNIDDPPISAAEAREVEWILNRPEGSRPGKMPLRIDFSDRFLAKLSIGLSHTVLGPAASASPYADELRRLLWSRNPDERGDLRVRGSGFWDQGALDAVSKSLGWPGVWTIALAKAGPAFGVALCTPGGKSMSMMISDDPSLWKPSVQSDFHGGVIYLIVPQRNRSFGPVPLPEYVSHRLGRSKNMDLIDLKELEIDLRQLPEKRRG
ncbi:MAG TPA: hypothetical protein VM715_16740, partial [Candidatus Acidoferrum sp.]|nr:hypothetical protein [Candidatus Acidoferrum sp.]